MSTTMFAWQFPGGKGTLEDNLVFNSAAPLPPMTKDTVARIKVLRMALNPIDYKATEVSIGARLIGLPLTPGMDCIGRVSETNTPNLAVGDLVAVKHATPSKYGVAAEYTIATKKDAIVKVDEAGISALDELACSGVASGTALVSLAGLPQGSKVLINGASGGTGVWGVQAAKAAGYEVVAVCSSRNVDLMKTIGADDVIDYTKGDLVTAVKENVARTGRQFDRIVDNVSSSPQLYYRAHEYLVPKGKFMFVGAPMEASFIWKALMIHILPAFLGGGRRKPVRILGNGEDAELKRSTELVLEGKITLPIQKFALHQLPEGYRALKTGRTVGKIILHVSD
ncbi:Zinc-type alcohol dehydrogenase-like protein C16A3.02c [Ceratocystis lukuohia]|uniref:Zinc-type alcohol dehydrogenase-like protein C16A3.02c n=1 Tax=Ceratocystis lukuohia TaxID=2019550 RepID=A0ABR4MRQ3_9PEZI